MGTGAAVLGPIAVGDDVVICANANILKNAPSDSVVIPSPSFILKQNRKSVYIKL
jgi:serine acetyltransferase